MFSYQLYSSRNFPPLSQHASKMLAKAGYTAVEGYGGLYADDAALAATAGGPEGHRADHADRAFRPGPARDRRRQGRLEHRQGAGDEAVYCPYVMPDDRPTDARGLAGVRRAAAKGGRALQGGGLWLWLAQP